MHTLQTHLMGLLRIQPLAKAQDALRIEAARVAASRLLAHDSMAPLCARWGADPLAGLEAGLPSEAQWEHACRAGTETPFWHGEQITPEQVNYHGSYPYNGGEKGEYRKKTMPVKTFEPNGWGLYEMHGNVWEWVADEYVGYTGGAVIDPKAGPELQGEKGAAGGRRRVQRGGSWLVNGRLCRSASRYASPPGGRARNFGFRLASE